jgi:hypothetical protein
MPGAKRKSLSGRSWRPPPTTLQLRIALLGIRPPIWRRVLVPSDGSGEYLHQVIQVAMGWQDSHMHHFILGKRPDLILVEHPDVLDDPMFPAREEPNTLDSTQITIDELLRKGGGRVLYEYDFGDGWMHAVKLEKELPTDSTMAVPQCLDGKRACPPEDCGGTGGYDEIVRLVKDPKFKPEGRSREELLEWLGGEYDPELFEVDEVNKQFRPPRKSTKKRSRRS